MEGVSSPRVPSVTGERTAPPAVLVIDDDDAVRRSADRVLTHAGYSCESVATAAEARSSCDRQSFQLAVCDVGLQAGEGIELIGELKAIRSDLAFLMISGDDRPLVADIAADRGAYGYLVKPFSSRELVINAGNALARGRLELEARMIRERLEKIVRDQTSELSAAMEDLRTSREETICRLSTAIEMRDVPTAEHVGNVGHISAIVAEGLGWDAEDVELLRAAAPLHDVGKVAIPDRILLKPGPLTPDERRDMERHAEIGWQILSGTRSPMLALAASVARTHHEWVDGTGYPRGLAGESIPIAGRIVAIGDVFEALITDRVYRPAMSPEAALATMTEGRGTQFDERVFDQLLEHVDEVLAAVHAPALGDA